MVHDERSGSAGAPAHDSAATGTDTSHGKRRGDYSAAQQDGAGQVRSTVCCRHCLTLCILLVHTVR